VSIHNSSQQSLIKRANKVLPAGSFGNYDSSIIIKKGQGTRIWDEDGNEYVDYLLGSGPMVLGHAHPEVLEAVLSQLNKGTTFFANNYLGIELAEEICRAVPCAEQVRFVSTGSEADMYAIRLARAFTGHEKIIKFEGGYHGMSSEAQISLAPDELANFPIGVPDSAGITQGVREKVLVAPYNDIASLQSILNENEKDIAAIIVEPLQRIIPANPGFLEAIRAECDKRDIVLIFDEVVTGFRFAYGGAQELYGVKPDICTLGKIIGGGFALAAITGKQEIMAHFDIKKVGKKNSLMQIGTLSGNPVAAAAGLKSLEIMRRPGQYEKLYSNGQRLMDSLTKNLTTAGVPHRILGHQTMFDVVFTDENVYDYRGIIRGDKSKAAKLNKVLHTEGIFKSPSKTYIALVLTEEDLQKTEQAIEKAVNAIA
jgi:glutamate-1-semialdehyde 2,1-aminomutase